jgi:hypothetical protein
MNKLTPQQIKDLIITGEDAFWAKIVERLKNDHGLAPRSGDLSPECTAAITLANEAAVAQWLEFNVYESTKDKMFRVIHRLTPEQVMASTDDTFEHLRDDLKGPDGKLDARQTAFVWIDGETGWFFHERKTGVFHAIVGRDEVEFPLAQQAIDYMRREFFG